MWEIISLYLGAWAGMPKEPRRLQAMGRGWNPIYLSNSVTQLTHSLSGCRTSPLSLKRNTPMIHYSIGTPTWVELRSPDVEASIAFYHELFGWKASEEKRSSGSRMFSSGDKLVSGVRPLHGTQISPQWITYVSTDDAAQTVS